MDGCDHSDFGPPAVAPEQSVDGGISPAAAPAGVPCGLCLDGTTFDEPSNREDDGKSRRAAPWPFLIRRLG